MLLAQFERLKDGLNRFKEWNLFVSKQINPFFTFFEEKTERSDEYTSRRKKYGQRKEYPIL